MLSALLISHPCQVFERADDLSSALSIERMIGKPARLAAYCKLCRDVEIKEIGERASEDLRFQRRDAARLCKRTSALLRSGIALLHRSWQPDGRPCRSAQYMSHRL